MWGRCPVPVQHAAAGSPAAVAAQVTRPCARSSSSRSSAYTPATCGCQGHDRLQPLGEPRAAGPCAALPSSSTRAPQQQQVEQLLWRPAPHMNDRNTASGASEEQQQLLLQHSLRQSSHAQQALHHKVLQEMCLSRTAVMQQECAEELQQQVQQVWPLHGAGSPQQQQQHQGHNGAAAGSTASGLAPAASGSSRRPRQQPGPGQPQPSAQRLERLALLQHPAQFTGWITHSTTVFELQQLHQLHGQRFNAVNLAAMLVQLARLAPGVVPTGGAEEQLSAQLAQQLAQQMAQQLLLRLHECSSARQAANAVWALAVLGTAPPPRLLQGLAQQLLVSDGRLLAASTPQELAMLAWGLSKLRHDPGCTLWARVAASAQQQVGSFKPQELAMLVWALAGAQQRQQQLSQAAPPALARPQARQAQAVGVAPCQGGTGAGSTGAPTASSSSSSSSSAAKGSGAAGSGGSAEGSRSSRGARSATVGATSSKNAPAKQASELQVQLEQLLPVVSSHVALQLQRERGVYKPQELCMLLWACAALGWRDTTLLTALGDALAQAVSLGRANCQDVTNGLWALAKLQAPHAPLVAAAAHTAHEWLVRCSSQELGLLLYGCSCAARHVQGSSSIDATAAADAAGQLWQQGAQLAMVRLSGGAVGAAEAATLLRAAALVLQPGRALQQQQQQPRQPPQLASSPQEQQQEQQQQQQAAQLAPHTADVQQGQPEQVEVSDAAAMQPPVSGQSSSSSGAGGGEAAGSGGRLAAVATRLVQAVDDALCSAPCSELAQPCYASGLLAALAAARAAPSPRLHGLLLAAARAAAPGMNRQQLCATAWAAARLSRGVADDDVASLMEAVAAAAAAQLSGMQPCQLAVLAWAHGRLWNLGDSLLLHGLARAALRTMHHFGPGPLALLGWAFARARHYDGALAAGLARRTRALLDRLSGGQLSHLAWALVTLRCRQPGLLGALAGHASQHCAAWEPKALVRLAVAFSSDRLLHPARSRALFGALAAALLARPGCLAGLTPHELVQLAVAFAAARARNKPLAAAVAAAAAARLHRVALVDCVQLVWALALLQTRHEPLLAAISVRVAADLAAGGGSTEGVPAPLQEGVSGSGGEASSGAGWEQPGACSAGDTGDDIATGSAAGSAGSRDTAAAAAGRCKLKVHHLARLAWSYRVLRHDDAVWMLAAARREAALQQQAELLGLNSSSNGAAAGRGEDDDGGTSSSSTSHASRGRGRSALQSAGSSMRAPPALQQPQQQVQLLQRPVHAKDSSSSSSSSSTTPHAVQAQSGAAGQAASHSAAPTAGRAAAAGRAMLPCALHRPALAPAVAAMLQQHQQQQLWP